MTLRPHAPGGRRRSTKRIRFAAGTVCVVTAIGGCTTRRAADASADPSAPPSWPEGRQVTVVGNVASIDRAPLAYDGSGLLVLSTQAHGTVTVHVPARINLCKARGLDVFANATVGMRIEANGTATAPADMVVCTEPTHRLKMLD